VAGSVDGCVVVAVPYGQSSVTRSLRLSAGVTTWRAVERRGLNGLSQIGFHGGRSLYSGFNSQSDGRPLVAAFPNAHYDAAEVDERLEFRRRERLLASHERPPNPFLRRPCQVGRPWRSSEQVMKVGH
jgi:hypothetical protein